MDKTIDLKSVVEHAHSHYKQLKTNQKSVEESLKQINLYNDVFDVFNYDYIFLNTIISINYDYLVYICIYDSSNKIYQLVDCYYNVFENNNNRRKIDDKFTEIKNFSMKDIAKNLSINIMIIYDATNVDIYEIDEFYNYLVLLSYNDHYYVVENTNKLFFTKKSKIITELIEYKKNIDSNEYNNVEYFDLSTNEEYITTKPEKTKKTVLSPIMNDTSIINTNDAEKLIKKATKQMKFEELQEIADKLKINTVVGQYKNGNPKYVKKEELYSIIKAWK